MQNKQSSLQEVFLSHFDSAKLGPFHLKITLAVGSGWLWAAYGAVVVGLIIPSLRSIWNLSSSQLGLIASFNLAGMLVGSVLAGIVADKIGRQKVLLLAVFIEGLFSLLSAFSWDYYSLITLRFITGMGIGAVLPIASTLVGEFSPTKYRGRISVLLNGFWGIGVALAALIGYLLGPVWGWRSVLAFGGFAIIFVPLIFVFVPESLRFLISKRKYTEVEAVVNKTLPFDFKSMVEDKENQQKATESVTLLNTKSSIWAKSLFKRTLSLWIIWFTLNFLFQGIFVWLPSILMGLGQPMAKSFLFTMLIGLFQVPGAVIAAFMVESIGRRVSLNIFFVLFGVFALLFGFADSQMEILIWGSLLGVCNGATWGLAYPLTMELYPTQIRGTGAGWATGFGRMGGVIAPFLVGLLLQIGFNNVFIYLMFTVLCGITSLVIFMLGIETKGRTLEELN